MWLPTSAQWTVSKRPPHFRCSRAVRDQLAPGKGNSCSSHGVSSGVNLGWGLPFVGQSVGPAPHNLQIPPVAGGTQGIHGREGPCAWRPCVSAVLPGPRQLLLPLELPLSSFLHCRRRDQKLVVLGTAEPTASVHADSSENRAWDSEVSPLVFVPSAWGGRGSDLGFPASSFFSDASCSLLRGGDWANSFQLQ